MPLNKSMSNEEQRKAHRDERMAENAMKMRVIIIALVLLFLIIFAVLSFTVFFHVSTIEVRGYSAYTDTEIAAVSGAKTGDNLFLINKDKVKEHIVTKLPYIGDVTVRISLPKKLVITVYETGGVAVVPSGKEFTLLNEEGKVLGKAASLEEIYENGVLYEGAELVYEQPAEEEVTETPEAGEAGGNAEAGETAEAPETGETAETPETAETAENGEAAEPSGEILYATPSGNVASDDEEEPEKEQSVYVLQSNQLVVLKGAKIMSAKVGHEIEFDSEKTSEVYKEIMKLFIDNSIEGITELDLHDIYNITMKFEDRINVKVGSVTDLDSKMAFAAKVIKDQDAVEPNQRGVIDLTIDKKAYFQPETTKTAQITQEDGQPVEGQEQQETTTEKEEETMTNSSGQKIQVARTTEKATEKKQP